MLPPKQKMRASDKQPPPRPGGVGVGNTIKSPDKIPPPHLFHFESMEFHHIRTRLRQKAQRRLWSCKGWGIGLRPRQRFDFIIPPASSNNPTAVDATELVCPFVNNGMYGVKASCRELCLVRARGSLYLWNHFMRTYKQVPEPAGTEIGIDYFFGLGYEFAGDDYKILKVPYYQDRGGTFELYSLRSDSWTSITQDFPKDTRNCEGPCVVVSGKLHWLDNPFPLGGAIISFDFDLSTERFGEMALPPMHDREWVRMEEMSVLKGMLCLRDCGTSALDIWVMEEYGVARSWSIPCFEFKLCREPLYVYENGEVLVWVIEEKMMGRLFVCDETSRREVDICSCGQSNGGVFVYVDSLVAPSSWSQLASLLF